MGSTGVCFRPCLGPRLLEHGVHNATCSWWLPRGLAFVSLHRSKRRLCGIYWVQNSQPVSRPGRHSKLLMPTVCSAADGRSSHSSEQLPSDDGEGSHLLWSVHNPLGDDEWVSLWTDDSCSLEVDEDLTGLVAAGGLMTDSVLELKWRAEARGAVPGVRAGGLAATCICADEDASSAHIKPIEDPARFYAFTRIAAPTALLGRPAHADVKEAETALQQAGFYERDFVSSAPLDEGADAAEGNGSSSATADDSQIVSGEVEPQTFHPYAVASLAQRMLRRLRAKSVQDEFIQYFQGDFDNFEQISAERASGILPREGGGHEHIHCSLTALQDDMLFARYYFNGNPAVVFRSRLYRVVASDEFDRGIVEMRIFRFYEETERRLKASNYDIGSIEWSDEDMYDWLQGCEVFWERYEPPTGKDDRPGRELGISSGTRFVGYMKGGGCELYSREIGGRIRVMDDLLLTAEDLWVSDRGFDEAGHFVYGNRQGVPYKMKRVHPGGPAAWTLSSSTPAPEGYHP